MNKIYALGALLLPMVCLGAGTITESHNKNLGVYGVHGRRVRVSWVADSSDGSLPQTQTITLAGLVVKVVTDPGSTAPTSSYDIACADPLGTLDVFAGTLANRHATTTEQVYPVASGATAPVYVESCTLQITGNSVNSATGVIDFYVLNP